MYPEFVPYFITAAVLILVTIKTILFLNSTSKRRVVYWFFFDNNALYNSRNEKTRRLKVLQNRFTLIIAIVVFLDIVSIVMFH